MNHNDRLESVLRRRLSVISASVAVLALTVAGCSSSAATPPVAGPSQSNTTPSFAAGTTMAKLAAAGKMRVGTKFDQPGFGVKDLSGNMSGIDAEITRMIAAALGIAPNNIEFTEAVSANRVPFLQQGKVDLVAASFAIDPERQKAVTFAGPYLTLGQALMVGKGNPLGIKSMADLAGKTVCTLTGGDSQTLIPKLAPKAKMVGFDAASKCVTALHSGQVDAFGSNAAIVGGLAAGDPKVEVLNFQYGNQLFGIGVTKGDVQFCQFIDDVLTKAATDGQWKTAYSSTLGKVLPPVLVTTTLPTFIPCS